MPGRAGLRRFPRRSGGHRPPRRARTGSRRCGVQGTRSRIGLEAVSRPSSGVEQRGQGGSVSRPIGRRPRWTVGRFESPSGNQSVCGNLMQAQDPIDRPIFRGLDESRVSDRDGVKRAFEFPLPELQEIDEDREPRGEVVFLPDIALQKPRMIGHAVNDGGGGKAVALELTDELLGYHDRFYTSEDRQGPRSNRAPCDGQMQVEMRKFTFSSSVLAAIMLDC